MSVGHADPADDRSHDSDEPLVGATEKHVGQVSGPVELFVGSPIHCTIVVPRESPDRFGREDVRVDHIGPKIGHEPYGGGDRFIVLPYFLGGILVLGKLTPFVMVGQCCDANHTIGKLLFIRIVKVIVGRTDHAGAGITNRVLGAIPVKPFAVVIENDCAIEMKVAGLAVEDRDGLDERQLAGLGDVDLGNVVTEPHCFDVAGGRQNAVARQFGAVVKLDAKRSTIIDMDFGNATA